MSCMTIALLGQPNAGKSTLFNGLTGSRQHVGNWPGKTVEKKEGYFVREGKKYTVVDLPGAYSLSANSDEEIVTRDYISVGRADLVCILADASQLERSLFMMADYAGIKTPVVLLLNMMDIALQQGKAIDSDAISKKLGIPVIPITASDMKCYDGFFEMLDNVQTSSGRIIDEAEILKIYRENVGEKYEHILEILPEGGIGAFSASWLAAKLVEQDEPAIQTVKANLDAQSWRKLRILLDGVENGSLHTTGPNTGICSDSYSIVWGMCSSGP